MVKKKKDVALLVSNKKSSFINFLEFYFLEKGFRTRAFDSRNSLYLYLLTNEPMSILVSRQFSENSPQSIVNWVKKKYYKSAILFDEKDLSDQPNDHYLEVLKKAQPRPETNVDTQRLNLLTEHLEEIINDMNTNILKNKQAFDPALNQLFDLIGQYIKVNPAVMSPPSKSHMQVLPLQKDLGSGYLFIDSENKDLMDKLIKKFDNNVETQPSFLSPSSAKNDLNAKFLGSTTVDTHHVNAYGFKCKLPNFKIIENDNMLETEVLYFSSRNPVDFDVYLYMENNGKDFHYLTPGSVFSEKQIEKLAHKNKRVRIKKDDKSKLVSHLNMSYMMQLSARA